MSLPDDVRQRIREEEILRSEIKRELDSQKPDENITWWKFFNSNLGILIVTSIFVTALGSLYTNPPFPNIAAHIWRG